MTPVVHNCPAPYRSHDLSRYGAGRGRGGFKNETGPAHGGARFFEPFSAPLDARGGPG